MRANLITGPRYPNQRKIDKMQENRLEIDKKIDRILYSGSSENLRKPEYELVRQKSGRKSLPNYPHYISHINSHQMIQIERQKTRIQKRIEEIEKTKACTRSVLSHPKFTLEPMNRSTPIEPIKSDPMVRKSREYEKPWRFRRFDQYGSMRLERRFQFRPSGSI